MAKYTKTEIAEAKAELQEILNPRNVRHTPDGWYMDNIHDGPEDRRDVPLTDYEYRKYLPTVYFVIDSVSRSGMSRTMRVYVDRPFSSHMNYPGLQPITHRVAEVLGRSIKRGWHDSVRVDGCGMDMTFHLLDCVLHAVFGYGQGALNANHYRREML